MNTKTLDGEVFLREELATVNTPIFFKNKFLRVLGIRVFGILSWVKGKISFTEALIFFLPARFYKSDLYEKNLNNVRENLNIIFENSNIYKEGFINLYGKKFLPPAESNLFESWFHAFIMIFQVVVSDQYHAKEFIKEDSIVIDAGANVGVFSAYAANLAKSGKVYSFEPTPKTYSILSENIKDYSNVKIFNMALGDKPGEGELVIAESSGSNSLSDSGIANQESQEKVEVKITTIDEFVRENNIERVDFIKMDTEGYEGKILEGAKETIKRFSPTLSLSAYHHQEDKKAIPDFVLSVNPKYKYKISLNVEDNLLFWVDEK